MKLWHALNYILIHQSFHFIQCKMVLIEKVAAIIRPECAVVILSPIEVCMYYKLNYEL